MYFTALVRLRKYTRRINRISRTLVIYNRCKKQVEEDTRNSEAIDKGVQSSSGIGKLSHDAGICCWGGKAPIELGHYGLQDVDDKSKRRPAGIVWWCLSREQKKMLKLKGKRKYEEWRKKGVGRAKS